MYDFIMNIYDFDMKMNNFVNTMYDFNMNVHVYEMHECGMQMCDFDVKM